MWEAYYPHSSGWHANTCKAPRVAPPTKKMSPSAPSIASAAAWRKGDFQLKDRDGLWALLVLITVRKATDLVDYQIGEDEVATRCAAIRSSSRWMATQERTGSHRSREAIRLPTWPHELAEEFQALLDRLGTPELRSVAVWRLEGYTNAEIAAPGLCRGQCRTPTQADSQNSCRRMMARVGDCEYLNSGLAESAPFR